MLMDCIAPAATCVAYHEEHLRTWKEASKDLFSDVPNIKSGATQTRRLWQPARS
jgi:hypothetical protein